MKLRIFCLLLMSGLMAASCGEPELPTIDVNPGDQVDLAPLASSEGRAWRRMNIDQLKASLELVSGGIGWTDTDTNNQPIELFELLAG